MQSEILQFAAVLGVFGVVAVLWLRIIYLPGRSLERWEDQRPHEGRKGTRRENSPDE